MTVCKLAHRTRPSAPAAALAAILLALGAAACSGGKKGTPTPPSSTCTGACSLGEACGSDAVCLLGNCAAGHCAIPAGAPAATARATVVVGAAGGTVDAVSPEGVSLHLVVPAGALGEDVAIVTEPQAAGPGEWLRIAVDPPGLLFKVPAELTLTLPGGRFDASATLSSLSPRSGARAALASAMSPDGRTLTASVHALGRPGLAPEPAVRVPQVARPGGSAGLDEFWEGFFLLVAAEPVDQWVPRLSALIGQLAAQGRYDDAAPLAAGAQMLLERLGSDTTAWPGVAHSFWTDLQGASCNGLGAAVARASAASPMCGWQARDAIKDVLAMGELAQKIGAGCTGPSYAAVASALIDRAVANMEAAANRTAFVACECNDPVRLKAERTGTRQRPAGCPAPPPPGALVAPAGGGSTALFDHTAQPFEWQLLLETVSMAPGAFAPLYAIAWDADAAAATAQLGEAEISVVRAHAFNLCADSQDSSILNELGRRVRVLGAPLSSSSDAILLDAQRCGAALKVTAETASHAAGSPTVVAAISSPGAAPVVPSVTVNNNGTLQVSGPIATLRCRDAQTLATTTLEADVLRFSSAAGGVSSPIDTRQANQAQNVLDDSLPFPVDVHTQLLALVLPTDAPTSFDLIIERRGPGCDVQPPSTTLFTVPVQVVVPPPTGCRVCFPMVSLGGGATSYGTCTNAAGCGHCGESDDCGGVLDCPCQISAVACTYTCAPTGAGAGCHSVCPG